MIIVQPRLRLFLEREVTACYCKFLQILAMLAFGPNDKQRWFGDESGRTVMVRY